MNRLRGRYDHDARAVTIPGDDTALAGDDGGLTVPVALDDDVDDVVVGIRPEAVAVEPSSDDDGLPPGAGAIRLTATVPFEEFHGADRYLYLDPGGLQELAVRVAGETAVEVGDEVIVRLPGDRLHYFDAASGRRLDPEDVPADPVEPAERERP